MLNKNRASKPCVFIGPRPVGAKHSDKKSTVSPIGYCPNASPVLCQQTLFSISLTHFSRI
ncbi:MAG: hypothetical protein EWV86_05875 [Microcystis panniformis Mp_MB_F_20051200_S9D]|nr:MAG: hypothetical protein EWV86_05875 [Microcystis panniformis Mp_MB_F_20051200_S9D]